MDRPVPEDHSFTGTAVGEFYTSLVPVVTHLAGSLWSERPSTLRLNKTPIAAFSGSLLITVRGYKNAHAVKGFERRASINVTRNRN